MNSNSTEAKGKNKSETPYQLAKAAAQHDWKTAPLLLVAIEIKLVHR